jgi:hypothetical protein
VNFHAGEEKINTPIAHGPRGGLVARAPYYGMLMFAAAGGGALVPTRLEGVREGLSAYAVRGADDTLRIALMNMDPSRASQLAIVAGGGFGEGRLLRLAGPTPDGPDVTFGGAVVDDYGGWTAAAGEPVRLTGAEFPVEIPPASAALAILTRA